MSDLEFIEFLEAYIQYQRIVNYPVDVFPDYKFIIEELSLAKFIL